MRVHISLEDEVVEALDRRVSKRGRSAFISAAVRKALDDERRWTDIESAIGTIGEDHDWDEDPAAWVHEQRFADERRVG